MRGILSTSFSTDGDHRGNKDSRRPEDGHLSGNNRQDEDRLKNDPDLRLDSFPKTDGHFIHVALPCAVDSSNSSSSRSSSKDNNDNHNDGDDNDGDNGHNDIGGDLGRHSGARAGVEAGASNDKYRTIGYELYGSSIASARAHILFFHGTPGTRFFFSDAHSQYALEQGVRVIVPERGGYGLSSAYKGRTLRSSAADAKLVLDTVLASTDGDMTKVYVVGYSAGGPVALAFAHDYPWLCKNVAIVSSLSPNRRGVLYGSDLMSRIGYTLATHSTSVFTWLVTRLAVDSRKNALLKQRHDLTERENQIYQQTDDIRRVFAKSTMELYARPQGAREEAWDYILMARDWGFDLGSIGRNSPVAKQISDGEDDDDSGGDFHIWLYGGGLDNKCRPAMYAVLEELLPTEIVTGVVEEEENHLYFYALFTGRLFSDLGLV